jgi:hypothetical protein
VSECVVVAGRHQCCSPTTAGSARRCACSAAARQQAACVDAPALLESQQPARVDAPASLEPDNSRQPVSTCLHCASLTAASARRRACIARARQNASVLQQPAVLQPNRAVGSSQSAGCRCFKFRLHDFPKPQTFVTMNLCRLSAGPQRRSFMSRPQVHSLLFRLW